MAAQSVTGKGQGMSHGKFKRANNGGCNCNFKKPTITESKPVKRGCYVVSRSGGSIGINGGSVPVSVKGC
jgi:hypothetical protein